MIPAKLGVLVSGRGSNLEAILRATRAGRVEGEVVAVLSNKPGCRAIEVARGAEVPLVRAFTMEEFGSLPARDGAMAEALRVAAVDLVIAAGYDRVLDDAFVRQFEGRILNVHPSLLPAFGGGMDAIRQAFEAHAKETGVTVHFIEPGAVDAGAVAAQETVPILPDDTIESLEARVHEVEHRLLPEVIQAWVSGSLVR